MSGITKPILVLWLAVVLAAGEALANPAAMPSSAGQKAAVAKKISGKSQSSQEESVRISADHLERDSAKDTIKARGKVTVRYQNRAVRADRIKINLKTGKGEATGHVLITGEGTRLKAHGAVFNLKSEKAKFFNVRGEIAHSYYIKSKSARKLSDRHYKLDKSSLTTCKGHLPDWVFEVDSMDVQVGDRALFRGATFKVRDVPLLHLPIGYVPLDNERKSGFLFPEFGSSNVNGVFINNSYFWAINRQSDATFSIDYMEKRGVRPEIEYRYTPSATTRGEFRANILDDKITNDVIWKVDAVHQQALPRGFHVNAKLDLISANNFNKTFTNNVARRTRRSTNSFFNLTKSWSNSTLDVLARARNSIEDNRNDTLNLFPQITHKVQRFAIGNSPFFFNQEASYTLFQTDLDPSVSVDRTETFQRIDFHPQISMPLRPTSWITFTPIVGFRETYYSKGLGAEKQTLDGFSRQLADINTVIEGPKFRKIYFTGNPKYPKLNHVVEPRLTYQYIPDISENTRKKIKVFDSVDTIGAANRITYTLNQRIHRKTALKNGKFKTDQVMRLELKQTYDIREATRTQPPGTKSRPFSDLRFDLDSRLLDALMMNFDTKFDVYDGVFNTANLEVGIKATEMLSIFFERRFTRNASTFLQGTINLDLKKGWRIQYSARFDEKRTRFQENDFSVSYNDPCKCWGVGFDFIKRNNINGGINQDDTRFMLNINLKGIGSIGTNKKDKLLHRRF
ncbi:MAG: LPS-assembly protein LptD [Nitrospinales bacterium]